MAETTSPGAHKRQRSDEEEDSFDTQSQHSDGSLLSTHSDGLSPAANVYYKNLCGAFKIKLKGYVAAAKLVPKIKQKRKNLDNVDTIPRGMLVKRNVKLPKGTSAEVESQLKAAYDVLDNATTNSMKTAYDAQLTTLKSKLRDFMADCFGDAEDWLNEAKVDNDLQQSILERFRQHVVNKTNEADSQINVESLLKKDEKSKDDEKMDVNQAMDDQAKNFSNICQELINKNNDNLTKKFENLLAQHLGNSNGAQRPGASKKNGSQNSSQSSKRKGGKGKGKGKPPTRQ